VQEKIEAIAKETYGAASVEYLPRAEQQIELYTKMGFGKLPICMAKTQYSFSADAAAKARALTPASPQHPARQQRTFTHDGELTQSTCAQTCTWADGSLVCADPALCAATTKDALSEQWCSRCCKR
jgi:hypothetical protein